MSDIYLRFIHKCFSWLKYVNCHLPAGRRLLFPTTTFNIYIFLWHQNAAAGLVERRARPLFFRGKLLVILQVSEEPSADTQRTAGSVCYRPWWGSRFCPSPTLDLCSCGTTSSNQQGPSAALLPQRACLCCYAVKRLFALPPPPPPVSQPLPRPSGRPRWATWDGWTESGLTHVFLAYFNRCHMLAWVRTALLSHSKAPRWPERGARRRAEPPLPMRGAISLQGLQPGETAAGYLSSVGDRSIQNSPEELAFLRKQQKKNLVYNLVKLNPQTMSGRDWLFIDAVPARSTVGGKAQTVFEFLPQSNDFIKSPKSFSERDSNTALNTTRELYVYTPSTPL